MTRLVAGFCLGGVALSIGLGAMEYQRSIKLVEVATAQQMTTTSRSIQDVLRPLLDGRHRKAVTETMHVFSRDPRILGVRLDTPGEPGYAVGRFDVAPDDLAIWQISDGSMPSVGRLDLNHITMLTTRFTEAGRLYTMRLLIDGPYIRSRAGGQVLSGLSSLAIVLGTLTLAGLLALRRWLAAPLSRIVDLVHRDASATGFTDVSDHMSGEFADLSDAIARMLHRLDNTTQQLRDSERAFEHLYEFAPAAMVTVGPDGRVTEANRRAAELLRFEDHESLIGADILQFIAPVDRGLFRQCIDRVEFNRLHRAELRLSIADELRELAIEFAAVHDEHAHLTHVRLALLDITETKQLNRHVHEQRQLMDLVIQHMSDAILLVSDDARIVTGNTRLAQMLHLNLADLSGQPYDIDEFWSRMELTNHREFVHRMQIVAAQSEHPAQEQFETADGAFLFQVIPVLDELHQVVARLWVVQEVSAQLRAHRLIEQQARQLRALRQVGRSLQQVEDTDDLLSRAVAEMSRIFDVEAVGFALRGGEVGQRCQQVLQIDELQTPLPQGSDLADAVAAKLMPRVLSNRATSLWTDLTQHENWTGAFLAAGFDSLAATSIYNRYHTQGVFWIARRGGKRIERHHLFLMEALTPLLSACADNARIRQNLIDWKLTDPDTALADRRLLRRMIARRLASPAVPWTLLLIEIDNVAADRDALGDVAVRRIMHHLASVLREHCRAADDIVRYAVDQFVVITADMEMHHALAYADRIRRRIEELEPLLIDGHPVKLTATLAVAASPHDHTRDGSTIRIAEQRLAAARRLGPNRIEPAIQRAAPQSHDGR